MAEIGIAPHIIEAVLNHLGGHKGGIAGIYNEQPTRTKASSAESVGRAPKNGNKGCILRNSGRRTALVLCTDKFAMSTTISNLSVTFERRPSFAKQQSRPRICTQA